MQLGHDDGQLTCEKCSHQTNLRTEIKEHNKFMHNAHITFKCDQCSEKFGDRAELERHIVNDHKRSKSERVLRRITCFKNIEKIEFLPTVAATNIRSLGPKIQIFIQEFKMRELSKACLTETWGKDDKLTYRKKILKMVHREGLGILSLNRKTQRGGGVAIIFYSQCLDVQELNVIVPFNIEIVWGIGGPKSGTIRTIIIASFYYPRRARKKLKILNNLVSTIHSLLGTYPDAKLIIAGDRNELDLSPVYNRVPNLRMLPSGPTHKQKQLDFILTSLKDCYNLQL